MFRYIVSGLLILVAGMLVLSELGISFAPILATAGVVGVAYREDADEVVAIKRDVAREMQEVAEVGGKILDEMEVAGVDQWADSAVVIRCRFKVLPLEQWGIRRAFLHRLKRVFDSQCIEIRFPHLTLYPARQGRFVAAVADGGGKKLIRLERKGQSAMPTTLRRHSKVPSVP